MQLKTFERIETQLKFVNPKLKTLSNMLFRLNDKKMSDTLFGQLGFILTFLVDRVGNFKKINVKL
jgi:hypothetical protein